MSGRPAEPDVLAIRGLSIPILFKIKKIVTHPRHIDECNCFGLIIRGMAEVELGANRTIINSYLGESHTTRPVFGRMCDPKSRKRRQEEGQDRNPRFFANLTKYSTT
jgi:hypothetical protein